MSGREGGREGEGGGGREGGREGEREENRKEGKEMREGEKEGEREEGKLLYYMTDAEKNTYQIQTRVCGILVYYILASHLIKFVKLLN